VPLPAAPLSAGAGRRRAARLRSALPGIDGVTVSPPVPAIASTSAARLSLVERLLGRADAADMARHTLHWLRDTHRVSMSMCCVREGETRPLVAVANWGVPAPVAALIAAAFDSVDHPLATVLRQNRSRFFAAGATDALRRGLPPAPFFDAPFHVVLFGGGGGKPAVGVLLVAGPQRLAADLAWVGRTLGQAVQPLLEPSPADDGVQETRERTLLYSIINAVTDPILLTDTEGRLLIANTRALTLFTASEEESEGRRSAVRMNNMLLSSALASKAIEETGSARRELLLVNPVDGSDLLFELLSTITQDPRQGTGVVSILRNVSDLRRASEEIEENYRKLRIAELQVRADRDRLNLIIDSVADPIVVTDASGETSLMNEPAERLFTIPARANAAEQRWVQSNDAHFSSFIAGMLASADKRRVGELALTDHTGNAMPVEAIAGKILSEHGELMAVVTILHDRREAIEKGLLYQQLKEASDELERKVQAATADIAHQNELLRRQAIELEQASALKTQFLANMSHEFRTPLNAMLGYTSMLMQGVAGPLEPPVRRQLGRIESNGRHLLTIINEILDISRIEAGRMPLQLTRFKMADLLAEVRAELEPIIMRSRLSLTVQVGPGLRPILSDRQKVKQIVMNLVSNALKFTHKGSVTITVRQSTRDRTIVLSVRDTGIGIAPADQEKIFDDFRQLDNSPTRAYGGTGLGLSICRRLAQMLDGRLSVQSEPGSGSTFTLTLPILRPQ
jgi:PAS domain S-box-containing protein